MVEVGPRDGLQNERVRLSVRDRVTMVTRLMDAGLRDIEVGSFVSPRWIPQMAQTREVLEQLPRREGVRHWVLVPNARGLEDALAAGATHLAVFVSSSETHNQRNLNRTIDESLEDVRAVCRRAREAGCELRGYISTVFGCPWEGAIPFDRVLRLGEALRDVGCSQISFGDTTGMGHPTQVRASMARVLQHFEVEQVALHLHDTRGLALTNALMGWEVGVRTFDGSVGGMGGCPYAAGASGNVGTEDLVHLFSTMGIETGVDLGALGAVARWLEEVHGATLRSPYFRYVLSQRGS